MPLSIPDRLALMLTRAGSMRALAAELGTTHQRVGRWLRGESLSVFNSKSPRFDPFALEGVKIAYRAHASACRKIANRHGIPFDPEAPAFWHKKPRKDGQLGDRVFLEHAHYISAPLREFIISRLQSTGLYYQAQVGSLIDLRAYFDRAERDQKREGGRRSDSQKAGKRAIEQKLADNITHSMIYTKAESIGKNSGAENIDSLQKKIRVKHEPATSTPGTLLATTYVLQLYPEFPTENEARAAKRARSRSKRHIRGRGNK